MGVRLEDEEVMTSLREGDERRKARDKSRQDKNANHNNIVEFTYVITVTMQHSKSNADKRLVISLVVEL